MIEERQKLEKRLTSLIEFIKTPAYVGYVESTNTDLKVIETRILEDDITSVNELFLLLDLRGQRKVLRANVTLFSDAVSTLESQIAELRDSEQQSDTQQIKSV